MYKDKILVIPEAKKSEIAKNILDVIADEYSYKMKLVNKDVK